MPRIVNGKVVEDDPPKGQADKPRIMTWNDITSHSSTSESGFRNRASQQAKPEEKKALATPPPPASVIHYISNMLGLQDYNLRIPKDNPTVVLNAAYGVVLLFFTLIFGLKMAVSFYSFVISIGSTYRCFILHRTKARIVVFVLKQTK